MAIIEAKLAAEMLSPGDVDRILRRAAEIDSSESGLVRDSSLGPAGRGRDGRDLVVEDEHLLMTADEVMRLGAEAGLRPESLTAALIELRRGLPLVEPEQGPLARALGPSQIVVSRMIAGPPEPIRRAVDRFLHEQLMTVRRHHGDRVEWERAQGIWPGLLRSLDFSKRYGFSLVNHVETMIIGEGDSTSVTFRIDVSEMRRERMAHMSIRSLLAFALVGMGGAALFPGFGLPDMVALASGGVAAGGLFALERRRYLESRARVVLAPERFLDLLVHRRRSRLLDSSESRD